MHKTIHSLARRTDLTALRVFVVQQRDRADAVRMRDAHRRQARVDDPTLKAAHLSEAERHAATVKRLPYGKRSVRRAAEKALRRAERKATS